MKKIKVKAPYLVMLSIVMLVFGSAAKSNAATLLVDPDATGCQTANLGPFATIQGALSAAQSGDTVFVCPNYARIGGINYPQSYQGPITISIPNLTIIGVGDTRDSRIIIASNVDTPSQGAGAASESRGIVTLDALNITFGNFTVDGGFSGFNNGQNEFNGVVVTDDASGSTVFNTSVKNIVNNTGGESEPTDLSASKSEVKNAASNFAVSSAENGQAIVVEGGTADSPVSLLNNVILNYRSNGILVGDFNNATRALVRGNFINGGNSSGSIPLVRSIGPGSYRAQSGIVFNQGAQGDIFNNKVANSNQDYCATSAFCGNGIRLDVPGTGLTIRFNILTRNQVGIFGTNTSNATINNNQIYASSNVGILLRGSDGNNGSNFNVIQQNLLSASGGEGEGFSPESAIPSFAGSAAIQLGQASLDTSAGNTVRSNTIQEAFIGIQDFAISTGIGSGATANTFIQVDNYVTTQLSSPTVKE